MAEEVCGCMGLLDEKVAVIETKTVVHENNSGALTLAKLEPGQSPPIGPVLTLEVTTKLS
jgi:hypothetical protein